ncbi:hypothetical protein [Kitasatospora kifunensis]|uniref:Cytochrome C biogenesis protein transmembrane domain-containing protein n=1 Tax=Kitasatospora kifunensis TaxID=58351 RepID=A0A7W7QZ33_KITKI|nr:hypothetical protein [Kitasatospora kifunensis]MBB4922462.1 hypothetical protein [Kitasatospora kifunensis]
MSEVIGALPRRRGLLVLISAALGLFLSYAWSAKLVDDEIGFTTANTLLGHNADKTPIAGTAAGVLFAFVSGLAGSFTACNIAVFGAVGSLVGRSRRERFLQTVKPLGWLAAGMIPVSAAYGVLVGLIGTRMPQFSTAAGKAGAISPRSAQSMIAFGLIGLAMIVMGLAAAGVIPDPLGPLTRRLPNAQPVVLGALVGGFLIGRPYPLFRDLFRHAATTHNPLFGAVAFTLQSIGNILVMSLLVLAVTYATGGRLQRRLAAEPGRAAALTATAFLVAGVFTLAYWDVKALGQLGYLWFPTAPWNS